MLNLNTKTQYLSSLENFLPIWITFYFFEGELSRSVRKKACSEYINILVSKTNLENLALSKDLISFRINIANDSINTTIQYEPDVNLVNYDCSKLIWVKQMKNCFSLFPTYMKKPLSPVQTGWLLLTHKLQ